MTEPAPFDYTGVDASAIAAGGAEAIAAAEVALDALVAIADADRTEANTLVALDAVHDGLTQASGRYAFLAEVAPEQTVRDAGLAFRKELDSFSTRIGFREDVYDAVRAFAASSEGAALEGESARVLEFTLRDFRRNGFDLALSDRDQVQALKEQLVDLGVRFRRNIDEYEDALLLTREQLGGLPDSYIDGLSAAAGVAGVPGDVPVPGGGG